MKYSLYNLAAFKIQILFVNEFTAPHETKETVPTGVQATSSLAVGLPL